MAVSCKVALQFEKDEKIWKKFEENDLAGMRFSHKPKRDSRLTSVVLYVFSGTSEARYNRCIKYVGGLQMLLDEGVEPEDIPEAIKNRGGIERLYQQAKGKEAQKAENRSGKAANGKPKSRLKSTKVSKNEGGEGWGEGGNGVDDDGDQDGEDSWGGSDELPEHDSKAALELIHAARKRGRHWLLLEARQDKASEVLEADKGRKFELLVKNRGRDENDLVTLRVVRVTAEEAE
jgi:hypothetical protein